MNDTLEKYYDDKDRKELLEHRDVLLAIGAIIKTNEGATLFKYMFKSLDVTKLPDQNLEGNILHECLGFLRAGNSIYKLACEADPEIAASLICKLERERYDDTNRQYKIERGFDGQKN